MSSKPVFMNIVDDLLIEWRGLSYSPVQKYNIPYEGCIIPEESSRDFPLRMIVQQGRPPKDVTDKLVRSTRDCEIGDGVFCATHTRDPIVWKAWIADFPLDGVPTDKPVRVWYQFVRRKRSVWPWFMFPELLVCFHVVGPLMEWLLSLRNIFLLHSGAVEKDGKAVLLPGRGGVFKTSHIIALLQQGWKFLSDDLVILKDNKFWPTPFHVTFFDYFYRYCPDERLTKARMFKSFMHLRKNAPLKVPIGNPASPAVVNLMRRKHKNGPIEISDGFVTDDTLRVLKASDVLEKLNFNDLEELRGRMFLNLDQHLGTDIWQQYWLKYEAAVSNALRGLPLRVVELNPKQFNISQIDYLRTQ
ncbi:MAG: hypothetical protein KAR11_03325 [Phycisphaerae bacterium]|nr:hypothetical protein [Phycisphaerae bacterium]